MAVTEGVETLGTAFLVLILVSDGQLDAAEGLDVIDAMLDAEWYCAPDLFVKILENLESLGETGGSN